MGIILGTSAADNLVGLDTDGDDSLQGLAGDDTIGALRLGHDTVIGGDGDDYLFGAQISAGDSQVTLDGGAGNDRLEIDNSGGGTTGPFVMSISGGDGDDLAHIWGGSIYGGLAAGTIDLGAGNDTLWAADHDDVTVTLGPGADVLRLQMSPFNVTALKITDFQTGAGGDVVQFPDASSLWLLDWDQSNPFAGGYLRLVQSGADTILQIDQDAGGSQYGFVDLVRFENTQASAFTADNFSGYPPGGGPTPGQVIVGSSTSGGEALTGTIGADTITGLGLNDVIHAGAGNDLIDGGTGDDLVWAEAGDDTVSGGEGDDTLRGGEHDVLHGGAGADVLVAEPTLGQPAGLLLDGGDGDDQFSAYVHENQTATLLGGAGHDTFYLFDTGAVTVDAGAGDDVVQIAAWAPSVVVTLGAGADIVSLDANLGMPPPVTITDFDAGATGDRFRIIDFLRQSNPSWTPDVNPFTAGLVKLVASGDSTIVQLKSENALWDAFILQNVSPSELDGRQFEGYRPDGGPPDGLVLPGGVDADTLVGGVGNDLLTGDAGDDSLSGGLLGDDTIMGGAGADSIVETSGRNYLRGEDGNDSIAGGAGFDDVNGNKGDDTITGGSGGADWLLGGQGNDQISGGGAGGILNGNLGDDILYGGDGSHYLRGGQGDDAIHASSGDDWISGDLGSNTIYGGWGNDVFHAGGGHDYVQNWHAGDQVQIASGLAFTVVQVGADVRITFSNGGEMDLLNTQYSSLQPYWIVTA